MSRGAKVYLTLHLVVILFVLALGVKSWLLGEAFSPWARSPQLALLLAVLPTLLIYFQMQFLAAWIMLGRPHAAWRVSLGVLAALLAWSALFLHAIGEHGFVRFAAKTSLVVGLIPLAVVLIGLTPELVRGRRMRPVGKSSPEWMRPAQFSTRAMFVTTLLAALFVGAAQFFPMTFATGDEPSIPRPVLGGAAPGGGFAFTDSITISLSAVILAPPLATVAAAYWLLLPGTFWRWLPVPTVTAIAGGLAAGLMESHGATSDTLNFVIASALGSLFPLAHFLILRWCGYRLILSETPITLERSPTQDMRNQE
jgi:hypothetical protein